MPELDLDATGNEAPEKVSGGIKKSSLREIDKKAAAIRDKATLPRTPGSRIDSRQWTEWARLLTPEMWSSLALYIYRTFPVIIRQLSDPRNDNNIGIATETVDIEGYIKELCGGGKYRVDVTDAGKKICEIRLNIPIHECEPKLDYKELDLFSKENQSYVQSLKYRGILGEDGKPRPGGGNIQGQNNQGVSSQDLMTVVNQMMGLVTRMSNEQKEDFKERLRSQSTEQGGISGRIGDIILKQMEQNNPNSMLTSFAALKDLFVKQGGGLETIMPMFLQMTQQMLQMQSDNHKATVELIKEMKSPKGGEGGNLLDSVESAMGIMERLDSLRGSKGSGGIVETVLEGIERVGLPLVGHAMRIYEINKLGKVAINPNPTPTPQPAPATVSGPKRISGMEAAANYAKEEAAKNAGLPKANGAEPIQPEVVADEGAMQLNMLLQQTGGIIVQYMNDDKDGAELAVNVIDMYKKVTYTMVANHGEEKLFQAIRNFPEMWANLEKFGEPAVKQFIHEFCHYEEFLEPEQEEEEIEEPKRGRNKK